MCQIDPKCQNLSLTQDNYYTLIVLHSGSVLIYFIFLVLCIANTVQYLALQKRYKTILLSCFYISAFVCIASKLIAAVDTVAGFTSLLRGEKTNVAKSKCSIDFEVETKCGLISTLAKLTLGYFQILSIYELNYAIKQLKCKDLKLTKIIRILLTILALTMVVVSTAIISLGFNFQAHYQNSPFWSHLEYCSQYYTSFQYLTSGLFLVLSLAMGFAFISLLIELGKDLDILTKERFILKLLFAFLLASFISESIGFFIMARL